jgi:hypothetical protein
MAVGPTGELVMNFLSLPSRGAAADILGCLFAVVPVLFVGCADNDPFNVDDGSGNVADFDAEGVDVIVPPPEIPTCDNECDTRYATRCSGPNTIEVCDDFNADGCTEWGDNRPCRAGYLCEEDACFNPNSPPTVTALALTTDEDTELTVTLAAVDLDEQRLRFELNSRPEHGSISGVVPNLTYIPDADFFGTDTIRFSVTDRLSEPVLGEVVITVNPVNDNPVFQSATFNLTEDIALPISLPATDADGDELTWTLIDTPTLFTLEGTGPAFTIQPVADAFGEETIEFRVQDGAADALPATLTVRIAPVNDAPVAEAFALSLDEDTQVDVVAVTRDVDSEDVSIFILLPPAHGSIVDGVAPGQWTYVPAPDYFGPDQFSYTIDDGRLTAAPAIVTLDVVAVADEPVASDYTLTLAEDSTARLTLLGSDVDLDPLTFAVTVVPNEGALTGTGRERVYSPAANYFGPDLLRYTVSDGTTTVEGSVTITVTPVNDLPALSDQTLTLGQDTSVEFELDGTDIETADLSYFVDQAVQHGVITGTPPSFTYIPSPGYVGMDSVTVRVLDESGGADTAVIRFDVRPVGQAPVVTSTLFTITEDTPRTLQLTANDGDTAAADLEWAVVTGPTRGTLTGTAPEVRYAPNANYNGPDSLTVRVTDGLFDSGDVVVRLNVAPVNDQPIALDAEYTIDEDGSVDIVLSASDIDGDPLSYEIVSPPSGGVLTGSGANRRFVPAPDASGTFRFTWRAIDASIASTIARITVRVNPINDPPTLTLATVVLDEDTSTSGTLTANDVEGSPLTFSVTTSPLHGELTGTLPDFTYEPDPDYFGPDSFVVVANDGDIDSAPLTAAITVTAINDAPTVVGYEVTTLEDTPVAIVIAAQDVDGDPLTIEVQDNFALGTYAGTATGGTYTPGLNESGLDLLRFNVTDGTLDSDVAEVRVTITPVEDRPTAENIVVDMVEDGDEPIQLLGADGDADTITYAISSFDPGLNIDIDPDTGAGTVRLDPDINGTLTATYITNDGDEDSLPATITVNIAADNDPPVVNADSLAITEDTFIEFTVTGTDADGDTLSFNLATNPAHGTLSGTLPDLTYTPALNYFGPDSFTLTAFDGTVNSEVATIDITVDPANDAPVGVDNAVNVYAGYTANGTLTATDVENDRDLVFVLETAPMNGSATIDLDGSFTYTANSGAATADTFSFTVKESDDAGTLFSCTTGGTSIPTDWQCDGILDCADGSDEPSPACDEPTRLPVFSESAAVVRVTIAPPPPLGAVADSSPYYGLTPLRLQTAWLLENDNDPLNRTPTFSAASMTTTMGGAVAIAGGVLTYTPSSNAATDVWNYTLTAADGTTANTSITFSREATVHFFRGGATAGNGRLATPRNTLGTGISIGSPGDYLVVLPPETPSAQLGGQIRLMVDQTLQASTVALPTLRAFGRDIATTLPAGAASTIAVGASPTVTGAAVADLGTVVIDGVTFNGGAAPVPSRASAYAVSIDAASLDLILQNVTHQGFSRLVSATTTGGALSVTVIDSTISTALTSDRSINVSTNSAVGPTSLNVYVENSVFDAYLEAIRVDARKAASTYFSIRDNVLQSARANSEFIDLRIASFDAGDGTTIELVNNQHSAPPAAGTLADMNLEITYANSNIAPLCLTASGNEFDGVDIANPAGSNLTVTNAVNLATWRDTVNAFTTFTVGPTALIFDTNADCYSPL